MLAGICVLCWCWPVMVMPGIVSVPCLGRRDTYDDEDCLFYCSWCADAGAVIGLVFVVLMIMGVVCWRCVCFVVMVGFHGRLMVVPCFVFLLCEPEVV